MSAGGVIDGDTDGGNKHSTLHGVGTQNSIVHTQHSSYAGEMARHFGSKRDSEQLQRTYAKNYHYSLLHGRHNEERLNAMVKERKATRYLQ